jgi:hypothetical protein
MNTYALAGGGFLKIGRSASLPRRVRALRNGVPFRLELIGHVPADIEADAPALPLPRRGVTPRGWHGDC